MEVYLLIKPWMLSASPESSHQGCDIFLTASLFPVILNFVQNHVIVMSEF